MPQTCRHPLGKIAMPAKNAPNAIVARLRSGGAWAFLGKVLSIVLGLLINALLARMLPAAQMGAYFFTLSLLVFFVVFSQFGFHQSIIKLLAQARVSAAHGALGPLTRTCLLMGAASCLVGALALYLGLDLVAGNFPQVLAHRFEISLWLFALAFGGVLAAMFRGLHDIRSATLFGGLLGALVLLLLLLGTRFLGLRMDFGAVVGYSLLAAAVSMLAALVLTALWHGRLLLEKSKENSKPGPVARLSLQIWGVSVLAVFLTQADMIVLGMLGAGQELAVYGAAARLVTLVATSLVIVNSVISGTLAELHVQGKTRELEQVLRSSAAVAGIPSILALLLLIVAGPQVLALVYGEFYASGATVLAILSLGQIVNVWSGSCNLTLLMTGHQRISLLANLVCGLLTLAALIVLAERYGAVGAAVATAAGLCLKNVWLMLAVRVKVGVWTYPDLLSLLRKWKKAHA
jgi:O-antigen/teichoic acid export membrane protein